MTPLSPWYLFFSLLSPLPTGTDRPMRRIPWVTYGLILANVVVYILARHDPAVFELYGFTPARPRPLALFTYQFIHIGFWHLLWNMVFLWLFGSHVEDALGSATFAALYFGGGVAAGLLHMAICFLLLTHGLSNVAAAPLVGASGAISSILAPFAVRFHRSQIRLLWLPGLLLPGGWGRLEMPSVAALLVWLAQTVWGAVWSLVRPESGGTAYWAHMGGFAFGLVAAQLTDMLREGRQDYRLQDARAAAGQGQTLLTDAVQHFRAFLEHDPNNAAVRGELARALAKEPGEPSRAAAATEMLAAVRLWAGQERAADAVHACAEARQWNLPLALTPRERLRWGGAADDAGDPATAVWLLRPLLSEPDDAPELEMARLKLGRLLLASDAPAARAILSDFLRCHPGSPWEHQVRDLLSQTNV